MDQKTSRNCLPFHNHITIAVVNSIIIIDCLDRRVVGKRGKVMEVGVGEEGELSWILSYLGELDCGIEGCV